ATRKLHDEARNEEEKYLESRLIELFGSLEEGIKKIHLTVLEREPVIYEQVVQEDGSIMYSMTESYRLRMKTREELYREGIFPEDPYKKAESIAESASALSLGFICLSAYIWVSSSDTNLLLKGGDRMIAGLIIGPILIIVGIFLGYALATVNH